MKSALWLPLRRFQSSPGETFQAIAQVYLNDPPQELVFNFARRQLYTEPRKDCGRSRGVSGHQSGSVTIECCLWQGVQSP